MEREHTIYLSSAGCLDIYPNNNPTNFINRLALPITLDPKIEYEIGLVSILYPNEYYGLVGNQSTNSLSFYSKIKGMDEYKIFDYTIQSNILAGDMENMVKMINDEIKLRLSIYYDRKYTTVFPKDNVFFWNEIEGKVGIYYNKCTKSKLRRGDLEHVRVRLNEGLGNILGFRPNTQYSIYDKMIKDSSLSDTPVNSKCGVDYIYIYTDIIQPTNFGGQLVNILDCFSLDNGGNKGVYNSLYKSLNTSYIDQVAIIITDQKGRNIAFRENTNLTCVLHIRPK